MIKRVLFLATILAFFLPLQTQAQERQHFCGMTQEGIDMMTQRLLKNKEWLKTNSVERSGAITYVPLKVHLVANAQGIGRVGELGVLDMICRLNEEYVDQEIQFFIYDGFNYIDHNAAYNEPNSTGGQFKLNLEKVDGAVNIYFCQNANTGGPSVGTTLGFYSPSSDWIIARKQEATYGSPTMPHEIGHFFSLPHPFNGWDFEPYTVAAYGTQAPNVASNGQTLTENQARAGGCKNCDNAGDFICDTPPSYLFDGPDNDCTFDAEGMIEDPCGDIIETVSSNWMDYFDCSEYHFTPNQKQLIAGDLQNRLKSFSSFGTINQNYQPSNTQVIDGSTTLLTPESGAEFSYYNDITIDWLTVPGATTYIIELSRFANFNPNDREQFIVTGESFLLLTELNGNNTYYWRVRAYNEVSACSSISETFNFKTGNALASHSISFVDAWSVQPNPVSNSDIVSINLTTSEAFQADIRLYDIAGKLIKEVAGHRFSIGENASSFSVEGVQNGMYILSIHHEKAVLNNKLVVAN